MSNILIGAIVFIVVFFAIRSWQKQRDLEDELAFKKMEEGSQLSDKKIREIQSEFEEKLTTYPNLPDNPGSVGKYIYREIMSKWYEKLISQNRYNQDISKKLMNDWIDYIKSIQEISLYGFLASEASYNEDEATYKGHMKNMQNAHIKAKDIENAFGALVGDEAQNLLECARNLNEFDFDMDGEILERGKVKLEL